MGYKERNDLYRTEDFIGRVRIALCDWLNYWAINGTEEIEDETVRRHTDEIITASVYNIEPIVRRVAVLIIAEPTVKDAVEVSDANISTALTHVMANALPYLL